MSNLVDIQSQIVKLQKQAADIKAREFDRTVQEIVAKMEAFGITVADLQQRKKRTRKSKSGAAAPAKKGKASRSAKTGATVAPKYRGPNGETWTGRGLAPRWLSSLIASGASKESFLIKP